MWRPLSSNWVERNRRTPGIPSWEHHFWEVSGKDRWEGRAWRPVMPAPHSVRVELFLVPLARIHVL